MILDLFHLLAIPIPEINLLSLDIPAILEWNTDANEKVECNAKFNPDSAIFKELSLKKY